MECEETALEKLFYLYYVFFLIMILLHYTFFLVHYIIYLYTCMYVTTMIVYINSGKELCGVRVS